MYVPSLYRQSDRTEALRLVEKYPFATVITWVDGEPFVNHLPVYYDAPSNRIVSHLARANPQARHFENGAETILVFHGPHSYITPRWYREKQHVPTWNYATVHIRGKSRAVSTERLLEILDLSVSKEEKGADAYLFTGNPNLPHDFKDRLMKAILGFEVEIGAIDAKFKLSQNRKPEDYAGVLEGLSEQTDDRSRELLELMLRMKKDEHSHG